MKKALVWVLVLIVIGGIAFRYRVWLAVAMAHLAGLKIENRTSVEVVRVPGPITLQTRTTQQPAALVTLTAMVKPLCERIFGGNADNALSAAPDLANARAIASKLNDPNVTPAVNDLFRSMQEGINQTVEYKRRADADANIAHSTS